ncbi:type 1 glutamine amidotransferase family protein [Nonomuraea typhae]|uniref:type 1 glutamine amidotransferase family protein n=1 Tax=Nonomuraea typhae TaxID=2603600 RepID=UPI0012F8B483|nr:type 1 glutamine amidotransferase family protein [Nonomuraea typhae]
MTKRTVHQALYSTLADWETGHAIAHLRNGAWHREPGGFEIVTVGATLDPIVTAGGLRIVPDITLDRLSPEDSAMLILPGADTWVTGELDAFGAKAKEFVEAGVPVAGICGATVGLARQGLLDERAHTSNVLEFLTMTTPGYKGAERYVEADAVTDGEVITAGATEPEAFAREIFAKLGVYEPEVLDAWFRLFHDSDASAFMVLEAAGH